MDKFYKVTLMYNVIFYNWDRDIIIQGEKGYWECVIGLYLS